METVRLKFWDNLWQTYKEQTLQECQMTYKRNAKRSVGQKLFNSYNPSAHYVECWTKPQALVVSHQNCTNTLKLEESSSLVRIILTVEACRHTAPLDNICSWPMELTQND